MAVCKDCNEWGNCPFYEAGSTEECAWDAFASEDIRKNGITEVCPDEN